MAFTHSDDVPITEWENPRTREIASLPTLEVSVRSRARRDGRGRPGNTPGGFLYSARNVMSGSRRAARRAGRYPATNAAAESVARLNDTASGSFGPTS